MKQKTTIVARTAFSAKNVDIPHRLKTQRGTNGYYQSKYTTKPKRRQTSGNCPVPITNPAIFANHSPNSTVHEAITHRNVEAMTG